LWLLISGSNSTSSNGPCGVAFKVPAVVVRVLVLYEPCPAVWVRYKPSYYVLKLLLKDLRFGEPTMLFGKNSL
jgi:hypothetical protein